LINPEEHDAIKILLQGLGVEILDIPEEVTKEAAEKEAKAKSPTARSIEILDDPVRMYLRQMGQVPLLTREQEVEISKRIEKAENRVYSLTLRFGVLPREMIITARRVLNGKERFDRVVVERKGRRRERYLADLPAHIKEVEKLGSRLREKVKIIRRHRYNESRRKQHEKSLAELRRDMNKLLKQFRFKQVVIEDFYPHLDRLNNRIVEIQDGLEPMLNKKKKSKQIRNRIKNEAPQASPAGDKPGDGF